MSMRKAFQLMARAVNPFGRLARSRNSDSGSSGLNLNFDSGARFKKGGSVKCKASSRADGCAVRGKTKGRMV